MSNPRRRPSKTLRRVGGIAGQVAQQLIMPDWLPNDLSDQLVAQAQEMWGVRGALLQRLMATVYVLIGRGFSPIQALQIGARQLNLPPRRSVRSSPRRGLSDVQVRQYHQRQMRRGRRPGQNPQMRGRLQRELEFEISLGAAAESMARQGKTKTIRKKSRDVLAHQQRRVDELRAQWLELKSLPNKTREIKAEIARALRAYNQAVEKLRASENHAQRSQKSTVR